MNILYIYRNKKQGPSIRRVFEPIAEELSKTENLQSISLPAYDASLKSIFKNIIFVSKFLKYNHFDIIHLTGDVYYLMWILKRHNAVVTVHDLLFYKRIHLSVKKLLMYFLMIYPLRYAKTITFISEKSKDEALNIYSINPNICYVVGNPVNPTYTFCEKKFDMQNALLLHLGTKTNKNLSRVIDALDGLNCRLHVVGKVSENLKKRIQELKLNVIMDENLSDEEIVDAYKNCDIVCFPSLYEGFGMPIIEGQAFGRPVVTSNLPPMNKIAGCGAVLVDPYSVQSIRDGIKYAMEHFDSLISYGQENVKKYSVQYISNQYLNIYKKLQ